MKRHDGFWDKDWALVDQIDLPIISEYAAALAQLKAGNIYSMGTHSNSGLAAQEDILPLKRDEPRISIYQSEFAYPGVNTFNFGWLPEGKSPFLDERVRQAVSMSWNRDLFLDTMLNITTFEAEGVPVESRWNTALTANLKGWWLDPKAKDFGPNARYLQHDIAEAKKLLAAAGYPNGFETISSYIPGPELGPLPKRSASMPR
jgi:peptide/nickel transport system substrate-binding protein